MRSAQQRETRGSVLRKCLREAGSLQWRGRPLAAAQARSNAVPDCSRPGPGWWRGIASQWAASMILPGQDTGKGGMPCSGGREGCVKSDMKVSEKGRVLARRLPPHREGIGGFPGRGRGRGAGRGVRK